MAYCFNFPLSSIVCLPLFFFLFVFSEEESEAAAATAEKAEVDARSIYVGNVSFLLVLLILVSFKHVLNTGAAVLEQ
jgi:hypothetical protein